LLVVLISAGTATTHGGAMHQPSLQQAGPVLHRELCGWVGCQKPRHDHRPAADAYRLTAWTCGVVNGSVRCTTFPCKLSQCLVRIGRACWLECRSYHPQPMVRRARSPLGSATFLAPPRRRGSARRTADPEPAPSFRAPRSADRHTGRACQTRGNVGLGRHSSAAQDS
jgi:hypothetical protein